MASLSTGDYPAYYAPYVEMVGVGQSVFALLERQQQAFPAFVRQIPESLLGYRYQEGKWSVQELVGHVVDVERIMGYRMHSFARGEQHTLPGFDENAFVKESQAMGRPLVSWLAEFEALRLANRLLLESLDERRLGLVGNANGVNISVLAIAHVLYGHAAHHQQVLRQRYLPKEEKG